jgi:hypothetical protein
MKKVRKAPRAAQQEILARRRNNLRAIAAQRGGVTGLAKPLGYSGPSYLSQMIGPQHNRPITEGTARHIEQALGLAIGWLDQDHGYFIEPTNGAASEPQTVPVDEPLFLQVADVLRPMLAETPLPKEKAHAVFARVYAMAERTGSVDPEFARDLIRLAL